MHARPPASVEIFSSGPPARAHVDIAYLEAKRATSVSFDAMQELFAQLRDEAARMGCDGVVIGGLTSSADVNPNLSRRAIMATCIVYTNESVAATPKPGSDHPGQ